MQRLLDILMYPFTAPMDFKGQHDVERLYQWLIAIPTVIGFFHGYAMKDFTFTVYWWGAASLLAAVLTIPVWPMWSRHPVKWLPAPEE